MTRLEEQELRENLDQLVDDQEVIERELELAEEAEDRRWYEELLEEFEQLENEIQFLERMLRTW